MKYQFLKHKIQTVLSHIQLVWFQEKRKKKIRRNQTANVLFVVLVPSIWKYAYLYQLLLQDKRFNLRVTVAPWFKSNESGVKLQNDIESTEKKIREMGCNVIAAIIS